MIITAVALIIIGAAILVAAAAISGGNALSSLKVKAKEKTFTAEEDFNNISVDIDTEDIVFSLSEDGTCRVTCYEQSKVEHSVSVTDGTLQIKVNDQRKWYDYITSPFSFSKPGKITVYLPKESYSSLSLNASTADISVLKGFSFGSARLKLSTGDIYFAASVEGRLEAELSTGDTVFEGVKAGEIDLFATTGDVTLKNTVCKGNLNVKLTTGDLKFDGADGKDITAETSTGDVTGELLSNKVFITKTSTGDIKVPKSTSGGKCEITTSTGDIIIDIKEK